MTDAATLAAAHGDVISGPIAILLAVAAVIWVLWSRMLGQPLKPRRLLVLPVVLALIGASNLTGSSAPRLTATDIAFLAAGVAVSAVLGASRGATIELYPRDGELWQRYRASTVVWWVALVVAKVALAGVASGVGAAAGGDTDGILLSLGASLLAESAVVGLRALSTGLPFASERTEVGRRQAVTTRRDAPGQARLRVQGSAAPGWDNAMSMSVPTHDHPAAASGSEGWRSPGWRDALAWLRSRLDEAGDARR